MKNTLRLSLALLAGGALSASATLVTHFDHSGSGPYSAGNLNVSSFTYTSTMVLDDYSDSAAKFTQGAGGYTGPTLYAGARIEANTIDNGDFYRILYRPGEGLRFQFNNTDTTTTPSFVELSYVSMWLKQDFINDANTAPSIQMGASDSLSVTLAHNNQATELRFVVREGTNYYVSEFAATSFPDPAPQVITLNFASGDGNWALWDPSDASFNGNSASFGPQDFQNITGVGVFGIAAGASTALADIRNFEANLTVIPEPSTYAMLIGLGVLGGTIARRKRASRSAQA